MATVKCSNCGALVKLPEKSGFAFGQTVSKEMKGDYVLPMETTNNTKKEENKNMNMNEFNLDVLAQLVAAQLKGENVSAQKVTENVTKVDVSKLDNSTAEDKNHWATTSQFYGKDICGYAYNPYMIRRFLPSQFKQLAAKYSYNVHKGITKEYSYLYSITYTIEEVRKLAMLEKRDKIAFDERKHIFTLDKCRKIFLQYLNDIITHLNVEANYYVIHNKVGKPYGCGIKGYGWMTAGTVSEKIENHKVVKYLEKTAQFDKVFEDIEVLKRKIRYCRSYAELYKIVSNMPLIRVPAEHKKSKEFMDCFIKAGAYYTLKQQFMFDESACFKGRKGRLAVIALREMLDRGMEGYKIYAMLKEVNHIYTR